MTLTIRVAFLALKRSSTAYRHPFISLAGSWRGRAALSGLSLLMVAALVAITTRYPLCRRKCVHASGNTNAGQREGCFLDGRVSVLCLPQLSQALRLWLRGRLVLRCTGGSRVDARPEILV
jgi:hypothetical protein